MMRALYLQLNYTTHTQMLTHASMHYSIIYSKPKTFKFKLILHYYHKNLFTYSNKAESKQTNNSKLRQDIYELCELYIMCVVVNVKTI